MAIKFVLFLFFLVVEGEQFGSLLVLCSTVIKIPGNAVQFMRSKFSHSINQYP